MTFHVQTAKRGHDNSSSFLFRRSAHTACSAREEKKVVLRDDAIVWRAAAGEDVQVQFFQCWTSMEHLELELIGKLGRQRQTCQARQVPVPSPARSNDRRSKTRRRSFIGVTITIVLNTLETVGSIQLVGGWNKAKVPVRIVSQFQHLKRLSRFERGGMKCQSAPASQTQNPDSRKVRCINMGQYPCKSTLRYYNRGD